jgi:hypothetical protein
VVRCYLVVLSLPDIGDMGVRGQRGSQGKHSMCGVSIGKANNGQKKWSLVIDESNMLSVSLEAT